MSSSPVTGPSGAGADTAAWRRAGRAARVGRRPSAATASPPPPVSSATATAAGGPATLRLVGSDNAAPGGVQGVGEPITHAADPRWVLAVRAAEQLEGTLLSPEKRQKLVRLGRVMGLTPFDCNLVIAIVQDQARRGHAAAYCPAAGEAQLAMVPMPRRESWLARMRQRPVLLVSALLTTLVIVELLLLRWLW